MKTLDVLQEPVLILNRERQIVYANRPLLETLGATEDRVVVGLRPGEAVGCIYSASPYAPSGCGTSPFCRTCGAVQAILGSLKGDAGVQECSIIRCDNGDALNLRVRSTNLEIAGESLVMFTLLDISQRKRREELERIFFHDMMNTAGALQGFTELLETTPQERHPRIRSRLAMTVQRLIDEINSYRIIAAAERNGLQCDFMPVRTLEFLEDILSGFEAHAQACGRRLTLGEESNDVVLETDSGLLSRVIVNMIKNAIEATPEGGCVTVRCERAFDQVRFSVHNPTSISPEVATQIFRRSFSTKGKGRGLGTYSMQLLGERYLKGRIWFATSPSNGTTFFASFPVAVSRGTAAET